MMEYKLDCGCLLWSTRGRPEILFCPLHKAAPEMYEALENTNKVLRFLKEKTPFPDASLGGMQINNALYSNEQALAKVEGGK